MRGTTRGLQPDDFIFQEREQEMAGEAGRHEHERDSRNAKGSSRAVSRYGDSDAVGEEVISAGEPPEIRFLPEGIRFSAFSGLRKACELVGGSVAEGRK